MPYLSWPGSGSSERIILSWFWQIDKLIFLAIISEQPVSYWVWNLSNEILYSWDKFIRQLLNSPDFQFTPAFVFRPAWQAGSSSHALCSPWAPSASRSPVARVCALYPAAALLRAPVDARLFSPLSCSTQFIKSSGNWTAIYCFVFLLQKTY